MSNNVFVIAEHLKGKVEDITYEMLGKAKSLASAYGGEVVAVLMGNDVKNLASDFAAAKVLYAESPQLGAFNPEAYSRTAAAIIKSYAPRVVLVASSSQGMEIAPAICVKCDMPLVAYASDIADNKIISQLYGGKIAVESQAEGGRFIASVWPGSFPVEAGKGSGATIEEIAPPDLSGLKVQFKRLIEPEAGDVDITQQTTLVSIGRGIQNADNLPLAQALADKLGAALCCSRPIVDNKWLPKTRQVGKSGMKVKPKVYIALGISGAPEHIEGMKGAGCIIAVNTDPKAPIFGYAHYGTTVDLFDLLPPLTNSF